MSAIIDGLLANVSSMKKNLSAIQAAINGGVSSSKPFKNMIIGGNFKTNPWIRGVSFPAIASGAYCADRFYISNSSDAIVTADRYDDSPTLAQAGHFSGKCLRVLVTTADAALGASQSLSVTHVVEGARMSHLDFGFGAERYTAVSFWMFASKIGKYSVSCRNGGNSRSFVSECEVFSPNTWEKKIILVPVDLTGTWATDSTAGLRISVVLAAGATLQTPPDVWTAGTFLGTPTQVNGVDAINNEFRFADFQYEKGATATDFELLPEDIVRFQCRWYARRIGNGMTVRGRNGTSIDAFDLMDEPMRATPTCSLMQTNPTVTLLGTGSYTATNATISPGTNTTTGVDVYINGFAGTISAGAIYKLEGNPILLTAEL